jgi:hypothetical protein
MNQLNPQTAEIVRRFWAGVFSTGIVNSRKAIGLSVEQAAVLAGMELSEWMGLEAGTWLPQTSEQFQAIAGTLETDYADLASFALFCWSAWEPRAGVRTQ